LIFAKSRPLLISLFLVGAHGAKENQAITKGINNINAIICNISIFKKIKKLI
jgi:hypothetical protein